MTPYEHRRRPSLSLGLALAALLVVGTGLAQEDASPAPSADAPSVFDSVSWQHGPGETAIGERAALRLPENYRFAGPADTQRLLQAMQNPTSGGELGFVMAPDGAWFAVFEFSDVGYVNDDEKDKLDANAILDSIRKGTEAANQERTRRGWPTLSIVGWQSPPRYNTATNNLEWAVRAESEGHPVVNFNTRILGRKGVMEASLVCDPEALQATLPAFQDLLSGFTYGSGEGYAEFRKGDKVAAYGLAALVTGGAAAVALKTGLLQKFWKFIVFAAIGLASVARKLVARVRGAKDASPRG